MIESWTAAELIVDWRDNAAHIRKHSPKMYHGEAEVWEFCANRLEELTTHEAD